MTINSFSGKYSFCSNFEKCKVTYNNITFNHSEGAFQAQKTLDEELRKFLATLEPNKVKRACSAKGLKIGDKHIKIELRPDWEQVKDDIMYDIVKEKFKSNADLKAKLLETGNAYLIEGNTWHDNYWGDCSCSSCAKKEGLNKLGKILMRVREELK